MRWKRLHSDLKSPGVRESGSPGVRESGVLLFLFLLFILAPSAYAQGTAQVIVSGLPPVLESPYLSDLEQSYRQGRFVTQFIYTSQSRQPRSFRFQLSLDVNGERLIEMVSEPNEYEPGIHTYRTFDDPPAIQFPLSYGEWIAQLDASVDETGLLPEGDYVLTIEPIVEEEGALIPTVPGLALFNVRYAEPPVLLSPFDQSNLTTQFPIFSWAPITGMPASSTFEYELLIVEVLQEQTPYQALESNPEQVREVLINQTSFVYSMEQLPLEKGRTYAWQVHARDITERLPVLDRGETEFYTFTVNQEGLGSMLTSWSYPVNAPFLQYEFEDSFELDPSDTEIFLDGRIPVLFNGLSSDAEFKQLLISAETQAIIEGSLTLNEAIALEVEIDPLSDNFTGYSAVASRSPLTLQEGLLLELGSGVEIDAEGIHPRGTQRALVSYTGLDADELTATYSQDFTFSLSPFNVVQGRVDFAAGGVAMAYADPEGFHLIDRSDPVIAQLPDRLVLPSSNLAYIPLKRNGNALVNATSTEPGILRLTQRGTSGLELILPALAGPFQAEAPRFNATLDGVLIDAATGALLEGTVDSSVPDSASFTLDALGIPFAPTQFSSGLQNGEPILVMSGRLSLFGRPVETASLAELTLDARGIVNGSIQQEQVEGIVYLDPAGRLVALHVSSADGTILAPLLSSEPALIDLDITGRFAVHSESDATTESEVAFRYTGDGPVELTNFRPLDPVQPAAISMNSIDLEIERIESLSLSYSFAEDIRYAATMESAMIVLPAGPALRLPLQQVELREYGLDFPQQEIHTGITAFSPGSFERHDATFTLIGMRMAAGRFDPFSGSSVNIDPQFDFEVQLKGIEGLDRQLASAPLTMQNAHILDGRLVGKILPYRFDRTPASWQLDAGELLVERLRGTLDTAGNRLILEAEGTFALQPPAGSASARCQVPEVAVRFANGRPVEGSSESFTPCDLYRAGDFLARLNDAVLRIDTSGTRSRFILDGSLASLQGFGAPTPALANGEISIDVVERTLIDADATIRRLSWPFPVDAPLFQLELDRASLTSAGFEIPGDSALSAVSLTSNAAYRVELEDDFTLGIQPAVANQGQASLIALSDDQPSGQFSASGFTPLLSNPHLPRRIELPESYGSYLDLGGASTEDYNLAPAGSGYTITTAGTDRVNLVLPLADASGNRLSLPISIDLRLSDAGIYISGSFSQNYSIAPVDLTPFGYPIRILNVSYDETRAAGDRLTLDAALDLPEAFGIQTGSTQTLPLSLTLTASGLVPTTVESPTYAFYNNILSLSVEDVHLSRSVNSEAAAEISGIVGSPVFGPESNLRYVATFDATDRTWEFDIDNGDAEDIALGLAFLQLDPESPPSLTASSGFALEMTGQLSMPASIGSAFQVGVTLEIGAGGIYAWPSDEFAAPQPLFNGFLTAHLDALNLEYDSQRQSLVATLDGAFSSKITENGSGFSDPFYSDRLPFTNMRLGTDGLVEFDGDRGGAPSLNLLRFLPSISVIDEIFAVDALTLSTTNEGLALDLEGILHLPEPDGRAQRINLQAGRDSSSLATTDRLPVSIRLDSKGRLVTLNGKPKTSLLYQDVESASELPAGNLTGQHRLSSVFFDFSATRPSSSSVYLTSALLLPSAARIGDNSAGPTTRIALGDAWNPRRQPGLILRQNQPHYYHLTTPGDASVSFDTPVARIDASSISLPDPAVLSFQVGGYAHLKIDGLSGGLPVQELVVGPRGITNFGRTAGPAQLGYQRLASFELGCFDYTYRRVNSSLENTPPSPRTELAILQSTDDCDASHGLTLTDRWMAGSFDQFSASEDGFGGIDLEWTNLNANLAGLARLQGVMANRESGPGLTLNGETVFRNVEFSSTGLLIMRNDAPGLSLTFNRSNDSVNLMPDFASASVTGGGMFLRPTEEDIELINLTLDERSNNRFSSNAPNSSFFSTDEPSILLPVELQLQTPVDSLVFNGIGLLRSTPQFSTLDVDGQFFQRPDELSTGLFLVESQNPDRPSLEGLANISLNYGSVVGGIAKTNFLASSEPNSQVNWTAYGLTNVLLNDTATLPGRALLAERGLVLDLNDTVRLQTGSLSTSDELNVTIWHNRNSGQLDGYTAFDTSIDLIPGYELANLKLYGGLLEDHNETMLFAANNMYADVPFVYTGPIDPWLSMQDGLVFGGDARNTTFRRMIVDARNAGSNLPTVSQSITSSLRQALDAQANAASSWSSSDALPFFAWSDSSLTGFTSQMWNDERSRLPVTEIPSVFESIRAELLQDNSRPDYEADSDRTPNSQAARDAWQDMRISLNAARRSAESDIFSFEGLRASPLVWSSDHIDMIPELKSSPVQSIVWPLQSAENGPLPAGFTLAPNLPEFQKSNLLAFKQNNEALDIQFLRAITGLELNLVNLKIARTPEQAADFARATSEYQRFASQYIADDWELHRWSNEKLGWLRQQDNAINREIRDNLRAYARLENSEHAMRAITLERYNSLSRIAQNTSWRRDELLQGRSYDEYLNSLNRDALENEFVAIARDLWFNIPLEALETLNDSLPVLAERKSAKFAAGLDSLNAAYGRFTRTLDPLYDTQTHYTTLLYGMAEEYWHWRSSIRRLDPEAVHYAFQFLPYRGNYRILADDLAPPTIDSLVVSTSNNGFFSENKISWTADHPVAIAEHSISISHDSLRAAPLASLSESTEARFYTAKPDRSTSERSIDVVVRSRGAGGVSTLKRGQFVATVDPENGTSQADNETPLVPFDRTPPPLPEVTNLTYSTYFAETPNTLSFDIGAMEDEGSGIAQVEYRIINERDSNDILQNWTVLQKSTDYFSGQTVETSLPAQEKDVTVRISVRATNGAGLTSSASESLSLNLDDSPPAGSIAHLSYFNSFDIENPNSLRVELSPLVDAESGIEQIEYAFLRSAQANLANASWNPLIPVEERLTDWPAQTLYLNLDELNGTGETTDLSLFVRITNGAGLQTVANQAIRIPQQDQTPPSEPVVALEHSGFYGSSSPNQLRIVLSGSQDVESGIASVSYRIIDGATGEPIQDWEDFMLIDPNLPTYVLPANERFVTLPDFDDSRSILVEAQAKNRAGLTSNTAVGFVRLDLDSNAPTRPSLEVAYRPAHDGEEDHNLLVQIGPSEEPNSFISDVAYRIVDTDNLHVLRDWTSMLNENYRASTFPGLTTQLDVSRLPLHAGSEIQVRVVNAEGLRTISTASISGEKDTSPPSTPSLALSMDRDATGTRVTVAIGKSLDLQSGIARVRYRIRNLRGANEEIIPWRNVPMRGVVRQFDGITINESLTDSQDDPAYLVDVEVIDGADQTSTVSAIIDVGEDLTASSALPAIELFYFDPVNSIRSNALEVTLQPVPSSTSSADSIYYRIVLTDDSGEILSSQVASRWQLLSNNSLNQPRTFYVEIPDNEFPAFAHVDVRLNGASGKSYQSRKTLAIPADEDSTAPTVPAFDVRYSGNYHPTRPNQLDLFIDGLEDPQSRISRVTYRVVDNADTTQAWVDWTPVTGRLERGIFETTALSIDLPKFGENATLLVEISAVNGAGLERRSQQTISIIVDTTPPQIAESMLSVSDLYDSYREPHLTVNLGEILDNESAITDLVYRLTSKDGTAEWTVIETARSNLLRVPAISIPIDRPLEDETWQLEVQASNAAGLTDLQTVELRIEADDSAPQMPEIALSYLDSPMGGSYLYIVPGAFRDVESQIDVLEYRIVQANDRSNALLDWINVPVSRADRISVQPIALPRERIPFDGALAIAVEFRATNGAGLTDTRTATIDLPGDVTPPDPPALLANHYNSYDPLYPNTVEIQAGSIIDEQSAIASVRYRIIEPSTGNEFAAWTSLNVSSDGIFPGAVIFEELPFLQDNTTLRIDLEVVNTAGLTSTNSREVRVDVASDATPPEVAIALHYFGDEMALVLNGLADPESKIQQVEYRFLDNVDQSELSSWAPLFEIPVPQAAYPKQSYKVVQPDAQNDRTLKVEVRVTNGAGLQTTVSKTVLFRQSGVGE